jgi:uncharacterized protein (TIGR02145 family)
MKKTILYSVGIVAAIAIAAIVVVGCNGDLGESNDKMYAFLEKFRGEADSSVPNYIVKFNANGGSGNVPKERTVRAGSEIVLPIPDNLSNSGYNFSGWNPDQSGKGENYGAGASYTPKSDITLYAQWTNAPVSEVTVSSIGIGASGGGSYMDGKTVTINAGTAPEGQQFINWTTTTSGVTFASPSSPTTTFIMPPRAVTVTANFGAVAEGKYAVTVSSVGPGASGGGSYSSGATVTINAGGDPPGGYRFRNWTTESNGVIFTNANDRRTTFIMPGNAVTVTANFDKVPTYKVEISSEGTGASRDSSYREGDTVTINAGAASADRRFRNWTVTNGGVTLDNTESITTKFVMPANAVSVTANFQANTYTVTVSAGTGATGGGDYSPGETVTIKAGTAQAGFVFKEWMSSNSSVVLADKNSATTTFIMPSAAVTVMANYSGSFTDRRDSKSYKTIIIGGKMWMAENLNYKTSSGSWCYGGADSNCVKYGRLYNWETAKTVCPSGWHLPDTAEWRRLVEAAGGSSNAGKKLKSTSGWNNNGNGTDDFGFSALPGGYRSAGGSFNTAGNYGYWWTATEYGGGNAYYRGMGYNYGTVDEGSNGVGYGFSVRCREDG